MLALTRSQGRRDARSTLGRRRFLNSICEKTFENLSPLRHVRKSAVGNLCRNARPCVMVVQRGAAATAPSARDAAYEPESRAGVSPAQPSRPRRDNYARADALAGQAICPPYVRTVPVQCAKRDSKNSLLGGEGELPFPAFYFFTPTESFPLNRKEA